MCKQFDGFSFLFWHFYCSLWTNILAHRGKVNKNKTKRYSQITKSQQEKCKHFRLFTQVAIRILIVANEYQINGLENRFQTPKNTFHPTHMRCSNSTITIRRINVLCDYYAGEIANIYLYKVVAKRWKTQLTHHVNGTRLPSCVRVWCVCIW